MIPIWIYENEEKILYFFDGELFKVDLKKTIVIKLSFEQFIREVDTCADGAVDWKRKTILLFAKKCGLLNEEE